jgi:hypothetical protein
VSIDFIRLVSVLSSHYRWIKGIVIFMSNSGTCTLNRT